MQGESETLHKITDAGPMLDKRTGSHDWQFRQTTSPLNLILNPALTGTNDDHHVADAYVDGNVPNGQFSAGWLRGTISRMKIVLATTMLGMIGLIPGTGILRADERSTGRQPSAEALAFFETNVRPILVSRCYSCHSARAKKHEGGLQLDSRAGLFKGGENGAAIVPGDADSSLLIKAIRYDDENLQMPPDRVLSKKDIAALEKWVTMGAPDPRTGTAADTTLHEYPSDPIAGRAHWAFQPLHSVNAPQVKMTDWPRSPIDAFVLARLEAAGLEPAPDAELRTQLRRLSFQLTGLPLDADRLENMLADTDSNAVEKFIDELLDSPQFGERWGRHWLDLARYADSNGLDENFLFREAWRYRNWVIDAVNRDVPLDRFLLEQIAGDLLPFATVAQRDQQRTAAGFLVIGPKVLLGNDPNERRMDVADEQLDTIGRSVLGLTLGCARCHDHKFDPVPTADYYALAGILTSTQVMETRFMLGQQRMMERLVGIGENGEAADDAYEQYWREKKNIEARYSKAKEALDVLRKGDETKLAEIVKSHPDTVAPAAADARQPTQQRIDAQEKLVAKAAADAKPKAIPPRAMIPTDVERPADESIRLAGQFDEPGEKVPRGFLRVVSDHATIIPQDGSGRLELGRWLTDVEHGAGRLSARVLANRVWYHLIGRGIVRTVDNFGRTGERPSHPELLDFLARQLIADGWSLKKLIRRIVLSRTFAMSSRHNAAFHAVDPENRMLWRAHRRRLDPESLRDAILMAAGTLNTKPVESTVSYLGDQATAVGENKNRRRTDFLCRSVYLPVIRNDLPELFDVFDFADPHATTGMRPQTMVATQGLFILNDALLMDAAFSTAERLTRTTGGESLDQFITRLFEVTVSDEPDEEERRSMRAFLLETEQQLSTDGQDDPAMRARALACHALFASGRFQILE